MTDGATPGGPGGPCDPGTGAPGAPVAPAAPEGPADPRTPGGPAGPRLLIGTRFEPVGHLPLAIAATTTFLSVRTQALTVVVVSRRPVELGAAIATHAPAATTTALVDATTTVLSWDLRAIHAGYLSRVRPITRVDHSPVV